MGQLRTANKRHNRAMLHHRPDHDPIASKPPVAVAPQDLAAPDERA